LIAPLQPESFSLWQSVLLIDGRTGWIQKDQISSFGGGSQTAPTQLRQKIVATARTLLGKPYHWGGLSEGVDCSGLVYLCYRANGIDLPRDAHEQFMKSRIMDIPAGANGRSPLQPADLIFLSSEENPNRMTHVMLYSGDGNIIEGPGTGTFVHEISMSEKLKGIPQRRIHSATVLK
ncbi:MAG: C40 family peptidase, partial [Candidatus Omnitrophica bacterium]|nr:C40 family peptidase [Candidatus Omnitrophota bacterium]